MKILFSLMILTGFLSHAYAQKNEEAEFYETCLTEQGKVFYQYIKRHDFDSLLIVSRQEYSEGLEKTEDDCLRSLITAYLELGKRDSAMIYIDRYLKGAYESMDRFGSVPIYFICDYRFGKKLSSDTLLVHYVLNNLKEYYRAKRNSKTAYGFQLIDLTYEDQNIRGLRTFRADTCTNDMCKAQVEKDFRYQDMLKLSKLLRLIKINKGYLTYEQVGDVGVSQNLMFTHAFDTALRRREILPIIKTAFLKGEYRKSGYVFQIARTEEMEGKIKREDGSYAKRLEELCKQYSCEPIDEYYLDL